MLGRLDSTCMQLHKPKKSAPHGSPKKMFLPTDVTHLCNKISKIVQLETYDVSYEHVTRCQTRATNCATTGIIVPTDYSFCATTKKCRKADLKSVCAATKELKLSRNE